MTEVIKFPDVVREKYVNDLASVIAGLFTTLAEWFMDYFVRPIVAASLTVRSRTLVVI